MDDLIEAALQEGGIHRDDRNDPLCCKPRGKRDRVLLADANVEETLGKFFEEREQARAAWHRGGYRDRALVRFQDLANGVGEDRRVLRGDRFGGAGSRDTVPLHVVVFGRSVAVPLLRLHVDEDRALGEIASLLEDSLDREQIVAVDGPEVREAELLEQDVRNEKRLQAGEDSAARLLRQLPAGHVLEDLAADVLRAPIRLSGAQRFEHARYGAHVRRDAHPVVIQHDDHPRAHVADAVHRFECHTRRERTVADDRDDVVIVALQVARDGHALRGGDRGPSVPRSKLIVLRLRSREEA